MKKTWIALALVLCIAGQLLTLSLFHQADAKVFSIDNAVVTVSKWNYVDASVTLTVVPAADKGSTVEIVLPDGQTVNLTSSLGSGSMAQTFSQRFSFPRTGDDFGNGMVDNGKYSLSQESPLSLVISSNMSDVQHFIAPLSFVPNVDTLVFIVYGEAFVSVSCYGVAL